MPNTCASSGRFSGLFAASCSSRVALHIYYTIDLTIENRRARPAAYAKKEIVKASFASRYMAMSGLVVLAFILYHLAHFTVRVTDPRFGLLKADPLNRFDVYSMMVFGFQNIYVSAFYLIALFLLALHLTHGISSLFQSLGLNDPGRPRVWPREAASWHGLFSLDTPRSRSRSCCTWSNPLSNYDRSF